MRPMRPDAYSVSPFAQGTEAAALDLKAIETDGAYFLHCLKSEVVASSCYLPDDIFARLSALNARITEARVTLHREANPVEFLGAVYSLSYLDGVSDSISRICARKKTGEYSDGHYIQSVLMTYDRLLEIAAELDRFWDAAYIVGYFNGLSTLLLNQEDADQFPVYFCFTDRDIQTVAELKRASRGLSRRRDKRYWTEAQKIMAMMGPGMVPEHPPFLDGVMEHLNEGGPHRAQHMSTGLA